MRSHSTRRTSPCIITGLILALAGTLAAGDLTTITGKTYEQVKILRAERDGLVVQHACGVTTLPYSILPPHVRKPFEQAEEGASVADQGIVHFANLAPDACSLVLRQLRSNVRRLPGGEVLLVWDENGRLTAEAVEAGLVALDDVVAEVVSETEVILKDRQVSLVTKSGRRRFVTGEAVFGLARPRDDFFEDAVPAEADVEVEPEKERGLFDRLFGSAVQEKRAPPGQRRLRRYELVQTEELKTRDLEAELKAGGSFVVVLPMDVPCSQCEGAGKMASGKQVFDHFEECTACRATGYVTKKARAMRGNRLVEDGEVSDVCSACKGTGRVKVFRDVMKRCPDCHGNGKVAIDREVVVVW